MRLRNPGEPSRRRWLQVSLRTFLLFVLVIGLGLGWLGTVFKRVHEQRRIVALVQKAGGEVVYDYQYVATPQDESVPPGPQILRNIFGDDLFARIEGVTFDGPFSKGTPTDRDVEQIAELPTIRDLILCGSQITDRALSSAARIPQLQSLRLFDTSVTPLGLRQLGNVAAMDTLHLSGALITDASLESLRSLKNLEWLGITNTGITVKGLGIVRDLPKLTGLLVTGQPLGDSGVENIAQLPNLRRLWISDGSVTEAGLKYLENLQELRELGLLMPVGESPFTHLHHLTKLENLTLTVADPLPKQGIRDLQAALPNCQFHLFNSQGIGIPPEKLDSDSPPP